MKSRAVTISALLALMVLMNTTADPVNNSATAFVTPTKLEDKQSGIPSEKLFFLPFFNFGLGPAPSPFVAPPPPPPQTVVIPPSATIHVTSAETPLHIIQSPAVTQIGVP